MKQKIGISCCYGIAFILYSAIMFFLEAASVPTFWIGSFCSLLMLALCLLVVWKGDFFGGIPHLHYTLGLAVSGFFCLQLLLGGLAAVLPLQGVLIAETILFGICALIALPVLLGSRQIIGRQQELYDRQQFIRLLTKELSPLPERVSDAAARKKLEAFQEAVRFSDPSLLSPCRRLYKTELLKPGLLPFVSARFTGAGIPVSIRRPFNRYALSC